MATFFLMSFVNRLIPMKKNKLTSSQAHKLTSFIGDRLDLFRWNRVRWIVGAVLLIAAILKWNGFGSGRASMLAEIAPQLEWMLIQTEFVVAIWLFLGWSSRISWLVSLLMFSSFAGASLMMVAQGRSSCGCLGNVEFNPLWILLFDMLIVAMLLACGWQFLQHSAVQESVKAATSVFAFAIKSVGLVMLAGLLGSIGVSQSAVIASAIARYVPLEISGQYLVASPAIYDAGFGHPGDWRTLQVTIDNRSDLPVTLIGAQQGCRCRAIASLPQEIPGNGQVEIKVDVRLGQTAGVQQDRFWILTNHQRQGMLICRWRADVVEPTSNVVSVVTTGERDDRMVRLQSPVAKSVFLFEGVF